MSSFAPIAELFAVLGLDADQFNAGLATAKQNFDAYAQSVQASEVQYRAYVSEIAALMGADLEMAQAEIDKLRETIFARNEKTGAVIASLTEEQAAILTLQKLRADDAALDDAIAAKNKELAIERKATLLDYRATSKEISDQIRAEMEENASAQVAADKLWTAIVKDDAAQRAAAVTASALEQTEVQIEGFERVKAAQVGIFSNAAVEARVLTGAVGGLGMGMGTLMARVPIVNTLLNEMFPIVVAGVFVDILAHIPDEIDKITNYLAGWTKEAQADFKELVSENEKYVKGLHDIQDAQFDIKAIGLTGVDKDVVEQEKIAAQIARTKAEIAGLGSNMATFRDEMNAVVTAGDSLNESFDSPAPFVYADNIRRSTKSIQADIDSTQKRLNDLTLSLQKLQEIDAKKASATTAADQIKKDKKDDSGFQKQDIEQIRLDELVMRMNKDMEKSNEDRVRNDLRLMSLKSQAADRAYQTERGISELEAEMLAQENRVRAEYSRSIIEDMQISTREFKVEMADRIKAQKEEEKSLLFHNAERQAARTLVTDISNLAFSRPKSASSFFVSLADDVGKLILKLLVLEPLIQSIDNYFNKPHNLGVSGGGGSSIAGIGGFLGGILGSIFGGGGAPISVGGPNTISSDTITPGALGLDGALASGGDAAPNGLYLVGEKGPEILDTGNVSSHVTPLDKVNSSKRSGGDIYIAVNAQGADAGVEHRVMAGVRTALAAMAPHLVNASLSAQQEMNLRMPSH